MRPSFARHRGPQPQPRRRRRQDDEQRLPLAQRRLAGDGASSSLISATRSVPHPEHISLHLAASATTLTLCPSPEAKYPAWPAPSDCGRTLSIVHILLARNLVGNDNDPTNYISVNPSDLFHHHEVLRTGVRAAPTAGIILEEEELRVPRIAGQRDIWQGYRASSKLHSDTAHLVTDSMHLSEQRGTFLEASHSSPTMAQYAMNHFQSPTLLRPARMAARRIRLPPLRPRKRRLPIVPIPSSLPQLLQIRHRDHQLHPERRTRTVAYERMLP